jgi:ribose-phosphate pyrophosphokinase
VVVVSPDEGSIKRASIHLKRLGSRLAIVDKRRASATETKQEHIIGESVAGRIALMFDDMISTGSSMCGAARLVKESGATEIHVAASHGVFSGHAAENFRNAPIDRVIITDSIPLAPDKQVENVQVLSVGPLLAEAVKRIHCDQSVSALFRDDP